MRSATHGGSRTAPRTTSCRAHASTPAACMAQTRPTCSSLATQTAAESSASTGGFTTCTSAVATLSGKHPNTHASPSVALRHLDHEGPGDIIIGPAHDRHGYAAPVYVMYTPGGIRHQPVPFSEAGTAVESGSTSHRARHCTRVLELERSHATGVTPPLLPPVIPDPQLPAPPGHVPHPADHRLCIIRRDLDQGEAVVDADVADGAAGNVGVAHQRAEQVAGSHARAPAQAHVESAPAAALYLSRWRRSTSRAARPRTEHGTAFACSSSRGATPLACLLYLSRWRRSTSRVAQPRTEHGTAYACSSSRGVTPPACLLYLSRWRRSASRAARPRTEHGTAFACSSSRGVTPLACLLYLSRRRGSASRAARPRTEHGTAFACSSSRGVTPLACLLYLSRRRGSASRAARPRTEHGTAFACSSSRGVTPLACLLYLSRWRRSASRAARPRTEHGTAFACSSSRGVTPLACLLYLSRWRRSASRAARPRTEHGTAFARSSSRGATPPACLLYLSRRRRSTSRAARPRTEHGTAFACSSSRGATPPACLLYLSRWRRSASRAARPRTEHGTAFACSSSRGVTPLACLPPTGGPTLALVAAAVVVVLPRAPRAAVQGVGDVLDGAVALGRVQRVQRGGSEVEGIDVVAEPLHQGALLFEVRVGDERVELLDQSPCAHLAQLGRAGQRLELELVTQQLLQEEAAVQRLDHHADRRPSANGWRCTAGGCGRWC